MADSVTFPCEKMKNMTLKHLSSNTKKFVFNDPWQLSKYHYTKKIILTKDAGLFGLATTRMYNVF